MLRSASLLLALLPVLFAQDADDCHFSASPLADGFALTSPPTSWLSAANSSSLRRSSQGTLLSWEDNHGESFRFAYNPPAFACPADGNHGFPYLRFPRDASAVMIPSSLNLTFAPGSMVSFVLRNRISHGLQELLGPLRENMQLRLDGRTVELWDGGRLHGLGEFKCRGWCVLTVYRSANLVSAYANSVLIGTSSISRSVSPRFGAIGNFYNQNSYSFRGDLSDFIYYDQLPEGLDVRSFVLSATASLSSALPSSLPSSLPPATQSSPPHPHTSQLPAATPSWSRPAQPPHVHQSDSTVLMAKIENFIAVTGIAGLVFLISCVLSFCFSLAEAIVAWRTICCMSSAAPARQSYTRCIAMMCTNIASIPLCLSFLAILIVLRPILPDTVSLILFISWGFSLLFLCLRFGVAFNGVSRMGRPSKARFILVIILIVMVFLQAVLFGVFSVIGAVILLGPTLVVEIKHNSYTNRLADARTNGASSIEIQPLGHVRFTDEAPVPVAVTLNQVETV